MPIIPLSKGRVARVDQEDYAWLMCHKWFCQKNKGKFYAAHSIHPTRTTCKMLTMHRFILGLTPGDGKQVDHINGNGLDNRRANLRVCTNQQNARNMRKKTSEYPYKGIWKIKKRWAAGIRTGGKQKYLGSFDTPKEAALAYNIAAKEYHGEFANLNILK